MTIKELKQEYKVDKRDNTYHLYSLVEQGKRMPSKYLCSINKHGNTKFYVDGFEPTSKFSVLQEQIKNKINSYEYDSEYYNPCYRKGVFEELIIHDYLDSLGFKSSASEYYVLNDKNIYGFVTSNVTMTIHGLDSFNDVYKNGAPRDTVKVILYTSDYSWVNVTVNRTVEDIKNGIDTLLKPLLITDSSNMINKSEKLKSIGGDVDIILSQLCGLDIKEQDIKSYLKKQLLEIADKL